MDDFLWPEGAVLVYVATPGEDGLITLHLSTRGISTTLAIELLREQADLLARDRSGKRMTEGSDDARG